MGKEMYVQQAAVCGLAGADLSLEVPGKRKHRESQNKTGGSKEITKGIIFILENLHVPTIHACVHPLI